MDAQLRQQFQQALADHHAGRYESAQEAYVAIVNQAPEFAEAWQLLGVLQHQIGRHELAADMMEESIRRDATIAYYHANLAEAYRAMRRFGDAERASRAAIELDPASAAAWSNLSASLVETRRPVQAAEAATEALKFSPAHVPAMVNLGVALVELRQLARAAEVLRGAVKASGGRNAEALSNLANALYLQDRIAEGELAARECLRLSPGSAPGHIVLASLARAVGDVRTSAQSLQRAVELMPGHAVAWSNLLLTLNYSDAHSPAEVWDAHQRYAEANRPPEVHAGPFGGSRDAERRLRVGYVSGDFRNKSVMYFLRQLIAHHDAKGHELVVYNDHPAVDESTRAVKSRADQFRDVSAMEDATLAEAIRGDCIDVLVDLAGHTSVNRMGVFARRCAAVQVTYLGYPNTTGVAAMDYRITDSLADPPGRTDGWHSEQLVRIDPCAWCYSPPALAEGMSATTRTGPVRFGCCNILEKISGSAIDAWSRILLQTPGSVLRLKAGALSDAGVAARVAARFGERGVEAGRLELLGTHTSFADHLRSYGEVDIVLDPFPYAGTTTTCEAMWMHRPVVTLAGLSHAQRVGVSLLSAVGVAELAAANIDAYVAAAVRLAGDRDRLRGYHLTLRAKMAASALCDGAGHTRRLEQAYRMMWREYCRDGQPRGVIRRSR